VTARWRVVRQGSGGTVTEQCRHRFEWRAYRCARRLTRRSDTGVFYDVRPVDPIPGRAVTSKEETSA